VYRARPLPPFGDICTPMTPTVDTNRLPSVSEALLKPPTPAAPRHLKRRNFVDFWSLCDYRYHRSWGRQAYLGIGQTSSRQGIGLWPCSFQSWSALWAWTDFTLGT